MTTVAWKDGVLAADKKASQGGSGYRVTKLFRTKTHAIAFAGELGYGMQFVEWFKSDRSQDCPLTSDADVTVLVMSLETGTCVQWECPGVPIPIEDSFCAIGSGQDLAVGAMSFGATAIEAVECASAWDNASGLGLNYARSQPHIKRWGKKIKRSVLMDHETR